ncbi:MULTISPECIES: FtsB family cell division protein [unclassified Paenarthrobacter]|uniref:FtsB family cell division protein n=1 Tax=unclassified Paenarthrobacter TaxID=2634190 RepID=UPI003CE870FA
MATRRPKVPRADALGGSSRKDRPSGTAATPAKSDAGGGDVIKAEFGGARTGTGSPTAPPAAAASGKPAKPAAKSSAQPGKPEPSEIKDNDPVPAKAFSGRMLALAVVMIAITIMLAPTVRIFLEKRAEISALEAEIAGRKAEQAELNKQLSRWQDPNYVKQQARDRINMVMPGETGYWVFGGEEAAGTPGGRTGSGSSANPANLPWVDALWESIRRSATD